MQNAHRLETSDRTKSLHVTTAQSHTVRRVLVTPGHTGALDEQSRRASARRPAGWTSACRQCGVGQASASSASLTAELTLPLSDAIAPQHGVGGDVAAYCAFALACDAHLFCPATAGMPKEAGRAGVLFQWVGVRNADTALIYAAGPRIPQILPSPSLNRLGSLGRLLVR